MKILRGKNKEKKKSKGKIELFMRFKDDDGRKGEVSSCEGNGFWGVTYYDRGKPATLHESEITRDNSFRERKTKYLNVRLAYDLMKLNRKEVEEANEILHKRYNQIRAKMLHQFYFGQEVFFLLKDGRRVDGVVVRVNRKTVSIKRGGNTWRVPPQLLTPNTGD